MKTEIEAKREHHPQAMLEAVEKEKLIQDALSKLPGKQRAALILRIYQGFSYSEIALQIKCSESSVKSMIHRGREKLKKDLLGYLKG